MYQLSFTMQFACSAVGQNNIRTIAWGQITAGKEEMKEMKDKDLPIDDTRHAIYTRNAKQCVQNLLLRYYDRKTAVKLWQKIQWQYLAYLDDEPALGGVKITTSIYDPILIFAWYAVVPDKPPLEEIQSDVFNSFMGGFDTLGKVFDLNRGLDNYLAHIAFHSANNLRLREIRKFPDSFRMGYYDYDRRKKIIRYSFTQCPNAEFARRHHMEHVLPVMCNCDHLAMQKIHACLIRKGTCLTASCCDYCIVGDRHPLASQYRLVKQADGLLLSVKKTAEDP